MKLGKNKQKFAKDNWQYNERESFFMAFQPQNVDICFWGDSITQRFPWQDYFRSAVVANRGIGSDTTEGILARLDSVEALNPKVITILAGINNYVHDRSPEQIAETYRSILEQLKTSCPGAKLLVTSILPVTKECSVSPQEIQETNMLLEVLCAELEIPYLNAYAQLEDKEGYLDQKYAADDVHLNVNGYQVYLKALCDMDALRGYKP